MIWYNSQNPAHSLPIPIANCFRSVSVAKKEPDQIVSGHHLEYSKHLIAKALGLPSGEKYNTIR